MLFNRIVTSPTIPALTGEVAQLIYGYLIQGLDASQIFSTHGYSILNTEQVVAEAKRIETLVVAYMRDEPGTEAQLRATISSDLLTVATVVTDVRAWSDGNPDESPSWDVYKASFNNV